MGLYLSRFIPQEEGCGVYRVCSWGKFKIHQVCVQVSSISQKGLLFCYSTFSHTPESSEEVLYMGPSWPQEKIGMRVCVSQLVSTPLHFLFCFMRLGMACHRKPGFLKQPHLPFGDYFPLRGSYDNLLPCQGCME